MTILATLAVVWLVFAGGFAVRRFLGTTGDGALGAVASAWILGIAVAGVAAPLASLAGLHASWSCLAVLLALGIVGFARRRPGAPALRLDRDDRWCLAAIALPALFLGSCAFRLPFDTGDEIVMWSFKSGAIAEMGRVDPTQWTLWTSRGYSYPIGIPAVGSMAAALVGRFEVESARILALVSYLVFAFSIAELLRAHIGGTARAIATAGLAALPAVLSGAAQFMSDLPFTAAIALAALHAARSPGGALALAHTAALATIRIDGIPIACGIGLAMLAALGPRARWRAAAGLAVALGVAILPWGAVLASTGAFARAGGDPRIASLGSLGAEIPEIARRFATVLGSTGALLVPRAADFGALGGAVGAFAPFGFLAIALAFLALAGARGADSPLPRRSCALLALAIVFLQALPLAFLASNFEWQLSVFRERAVLHMLPAMILVSHAVRVA